MQSDALIKEFLRECLPESFGMFFPDKAERLNFNQMRFLDAEVGMKGGKAGLLLIHIEVQAQRSPDFGKRMWEYYSLLRLRYRKPVFPMVFYLSKGNGVGVTQEVYTEEALGETTLTFPYTAISLPDLKAADWADKAGAVSAALATLMDIPRGQRARRVFDSLKAVWFSSLSEAKKMVLAEIIERLGRGRLGKREEQAYTLLLASKEAKEIEKMVSIYEERGIAIGEERGIAKGQGRIASRLLQRKFGAEAEGLTKEVSALSAERLEAFIEALLDFNTLAEAQDWLQKNKTPAFSG